MRTNNSFFGFRPPMWTAILVLIFSIGGLIDSIYLTAEHGKIVPCSVVQGCEKVLSSSYAEIYGVPTAIFGIIAYAIVFILAIFTIFGLRGTWTLLSLHNFIMVGFTLWLLYLQAFIIEAFCMYCLLSAFFTFSIFLLLIISRFLGRKNQNRLR